MNNKYYNHFDFYKMKSKDLSSADSIILSNFKTTQQETNFTCGPACAQILLNYYGNHKYRQVEIERLMKTTDAEGTKLKNMVDFFNYIGYKTYSSIDAKKDKNGLCFSTFPDFKAFVLKNLKKGFPIIIENIDYGGHYKIIIGYDVINNNEQEDMLIFADPYDRTDGKIDGYNYFPANRFYYMWFDDNCLEKECRKQPFVLVYKTR